MFTRHDSLKAGYDVVIIGAGGHGLACAYYLARDHGIRNVAVLEKGYIGGGNTGRNTTIIRSNYLTPEGVKFYDESVRLWRDLGEDFDLNLFYSTRGHYTLAHTDAAMRTMRWRAEVNKHFGVRSEAVDAAFVKRGIPAIDMSCGGHAPILGALFHEPGAIARHDAVAWGYGRGADRRGVQIHQQTEVTGIRVQGGRVVGVDTTRGPIATSKVVCAVAGFTPRDPRHGGIAHADLRAPAAGHGVRTGETLARSDHRVRLAACLCVPDRARRTRHGRIARSVRVAPDPLDARFRRRLEFAHARHVSVPGRGEGQPAVGGPGRHDARILRPSWASRRVEGFFLDAGWGTWGFKATPVCGKTMSHTVATGRNHPLIEGFTLDRFARYRLTGEKGAASVGH